jgi:Spy/CpxP family protein refolding chaperone
MKNRIVSSKRIAAIVVMTVLTLSIYAQKPKQGGQRSGCASYISDLTEEQEAKIDALRTPHLKFMTEKRAALSVLTAELKELEIADEVNTSKVNSKIDEIGVLKTSMAKERSQFKQSVRKILTEEQRVVFDAHASKRKAKGMGNSNQARPNACVKQ